MRIKGGVIFGNSIREVSLMTNGAEILLILYSKYFIIYPSWGNMFMFIMN